MPTEFALGIGGSRCAQRITSELHSVAAAEDRSLGLARPASRSATAEPAFVPCSEAADLTQLSLTDQALELTIPAGLMFDPRVRSTQLMVVIHETQMELDPLATQTVTLDVACAEMNKDQPTDEDQFQLSSREPSADLARLLASPQLADAGGRVRQFAIWTITDNPEKNGYMGLATGFEIFGTGPDAGELDQIANLFEAAGIDVSKYRALR
jgi:hypothetical protein